MEDVRDKVAVVTGGSRGIGAGLGRAFLRQGLKVGLCARSTEPPRDVPLEAGRGLYRSVDVRDLDAVRAFAGEVAGSLGPIDLWVNNAGLVAPIGKARDVAPEAWKTLIDVNVTGVFNGSRAFLEHAHGTGRPGTVISIGSGAATGAYEGWSAYCASKAAVDHFTRVLALEEKGSGIRVFSLAPGVIETSMQELIRGMDAEDFPMVERFRDMKKDGVLLDPESPADLILELAFGPERRDDDPCLDARELREG